MAGASLRERRSQFLRDHQISPWQGLGWTKSIPRDHHGKLAFKFEFPFYFVGWLAPAYGKGGANSFGIIRAARGRAGMDEVNFLGSRKIM